jgi:hypothetical protein
VKLWIPPPTKKLTAHWAYRQGSTGALQPGWQVASVLLTTRRLWRLDFDYLLKRGCGIIGNYLKLHPKDEDAREIEKGLCAVLNVGNVSFTFSSDHADVLTTA